MKNALLAFILIFASAQAHAEMSERPVSVGNGGHVVACETSGKTSSPFETFDLFEASSIYGYRFDRTRRFDALELASLTAAKIDEAAALQKRRASKRWPYPNLVAKVDHIAKTMKPRNARGGLQPTVDSREYILFPKNCRLIQTVNFVDPSNILVDSSIWESLSDIDQAALLLHEAIYWQLRENGDESDSRRTRRMVAHLLFGGELDLIDELPNPIGRIQNCRSSYRNSSGGWTTEFVAYRLDNQSVLQFKRLGGYALLTRTLFVVSDLGPVSALPLDASNPDILQITSSVHSRLDHNAVVQLRVGNGAISLRGLIFPGQDFSETITCSEKRLF